MTNHHAKVGAAGFLFVNYVGTLSFMLAYLRSAPDPGLGHLASFIPLAVFFSLFSLIPAMVGWFLIEWLVDIRHLLAGVWIIAISSLGLLIVFGPQGLYFEIACSGVTSGLVYWVIARGSYSRRLSSEADAMNVA